MDNANIEREKAEFFIREKSEKIVKAREKSKKRGEKALKNDVNLLKLQNFEKDIEKLTIIENKQKVQKDVKASIPM